MASSCLINSIMIPDAFTGQLGKTPVPHFAPHRKRSPQTYDQFVVNRNRCFTIGTAAMNGSPGVA